MEIISTPLDPTNTTAFVDDLKHLQRALAEKQYKIFYDYSFEPRLHQVNSLFSYIRNSYRTKPEYILNFYNKYEYVTLPTAKKYIEDYAFYCYDNLKQILNLADINAEHIGKFAFAHCSNLGLLSEDGIEEELIDDFNVQKGIVHLPASLLSLGEYAFKDCNNIKEIHVHGNLQSIGYGCFIGCTKLSKIVFHDMEVNAVRFLDNIQSVVRFDTQEDYDNFVVLTYDQKTNSLVDEFKFDTTTINNHNMFSVSVFSAPDVSTEQYGPYMIDLESSAGKGILQSSIDKVAANLAGKSFDDINNMMSAGEKAIGYEKITAVAIESLTDMEKAAIGTAMFTLCLNGITEKTLNLADSISIAFCSSTINSTPIQSSSILNFDKVVLDFVSMVSNELPSNFKVTPTEIFALAVLINKTMK